MSEIYAVIEINASSVSFAVFKHKIVNYVNSQPKTKFKCIKKDHVVGSFLNPDGEVSDYNLGKLIKSQLRKFEMAFNITIKRVVVVLPNDKMVITKSAGHFIMTNEPQPVLIDQNAIKVLHHDLKKSNYNNNQRVFMTTPLKYVIDNTASFTVPPLNNWGHRLAVEGYLYMYPKHTLTSLEEVLRIAEIECYLFLPKNYALSQLVGLAEPQNNFFVTVNWDDNETSFSVFENDAFILGGSDHLGFNQMLKNLIIESNLKKGAIIENYLFNLIDFSNNPTFNSESVIFRKNILDDKMIEFTNDEFKIVVKKQINLVMKKFKLFLRKNGLDKFSNLKVYHFGKITQMCNFFDIVRDDEGLEVIQEPLNYRLIGATEHWVKPLAGASLKWFKLNQSTSSFESKVTSVDMKVNTQTLPRLKQSTLQQYLPNQGGLLTPNYLNKSLNMPNFNNQQFNYHQQNGMINEQGVLTPHQLYFKK